MSNTSAFIGTFCKCVNCCLLLSVDTKSLNLLAALKSCSPARVLTFFSFFSDIIPSFKGIYIVANSMSTFADFTQVHVQKVEIVL